MRLSEWVLGNYHLGPCSPIAVGAILGALRSPDGDVCCWVNLQALGLQPRTASSGRTRDGRETASVLEGEEGSEPDRDRSVARRTCGGLNKRTQCAR